MPARAVRRLFLSASGTWMAAGSSLCKAFSASNAPSAGSALLRCAALAHEKTAPPEGEAVRIAVVRGGNYSTSLLYCVSSSGMVHFQSFVPGSFGPTVTAKLMPNVPPCPSL